MTTAGAPVVVVLVGPPGAGKTTIGRRLAAGREWPVLDTDELVVAAEGLGIAEIFTARGESAFRDAEADAVERALELAGRGPGEAAVVSLGGGAVMTPRVQTLLEDLRRSGRGVVVFLRVGADTVAGRLGGGAARPLLAGDEGPMERWRALAEERDATYRRLADLVVDTDTVPVTGVVDRVVRHVLGPEPDPAPGHGPEHRTEPGTTPHASPRRTE